MYQSTRGPPWDRPILEQKQPALRSLLVARKLMRLNTTGAGILGTTIDAHLVVGLTLAAVFSVLIVLVPAFQKERLLSLLSLLVAAAYYGRDFLGFLIVSGIAYAAVRSLGRETIPARRWRWAWIGIIVLAVVFTAGRVLHWNRPLILGSVQVPVYTFGMWPALKLVTLLWEVGSGAVAVPALSRYVIWTALPFTLGGPVLRLSQMPPQLTGNPQAWRSPGWWMEACAATAKLGGGILLGTFQQLFPIHGPHAHFLNNALATFLTGPIGFYLTTAGYFHWMELLARPAGLKLPPSFNWPVGRENISTFWMNWNMTATYVFRDYLFYNRWGGRNFNIYLNTLILFTMVGLWHEANAYWILWGFLHGLLFTGYLLWRKYGSRFGRIPLRGTLVSQVAARIFTYFCVCMCWYLPSKILQKLGAF